MIRLLFVLLSLGAFAQKDKGYPLFLSISKPGNIVFVEYPSGLKLISYKDSESKKLYTFPEELLQSYLSANNQEWMNSLYWKDKPRPRDGDYYDYVKKMDKDSDYFVLQKKMLLNVGSEELACIQFLIKRKGEGFKKACFSMKKTPEGWLFYDSFNIKLLVTVLWSFKDQYVKDIFINRKSTNSILNNAIQASYKKDGSLDLIRLNAEFEKVKGNPSFQELIDL